MVAQIQNDPVYQLPTGGIINGLLVSWLSTTTLSISAGQCRDSSNNIDIPLGANPLNGFSTSAPLTLTGTVNGVNGLDVGALGNNTWYAIYMIADSRYLKPVACIATLASNAAPSMPLGYDSYRLIGYSLTDGVSHFLPFYTYGSSNARHMQWDAPIQVLNAGASTTYANIDLSGSMPSSNFGRAWIQTLYHPSANNSRAIFKPAGATADWLTIYSTVTSGLNTSTQFAILPLLATGKPQIAYNVSTSDTLSLYVDGFDFYL